MKSAKPQFAFEHALQYWFGNGVNAAEIAQAKSEIWWGKSTSIDNDIRERFAVLRECVIKDELEEWAQTGRGRLALILVVDQFSRNIFRDTAEAFRYDYMAQEWCLSGLDAGANLELTAIERVFFYLPLEHSESRVDQMRSVALYTELYDSAPPQEQKLFASYLEFARQHHAIIERFGRFPHRNRALQRNSTPEELEFLQTPKSSF
ncbi:MAG: DUF924 domain-containing protein [Candidatus Obscuribacterales bacterium]|nr:DUF924 domain-containing protein [Steroidobacteraceae bacterium]